MKRMIFGCLLLAFCVCLTGLHNPAMARGKRHKQRNLIKKLFHNKARFGKRAKHKLRGKWSKIATVKARNKLMAETLGKLIPIMCRLTPEDLFECEVRGPTGDALVTESTQWPAGKMKLHIHIQSQGISLELSNKWKKHIPTKKKSK